MAVTMLYLVFTFPFTKRLCHILTQNISGPGGRCCRRSQAQGAVVVLGVSPAPHRRERRAFCVLHVSSTSLHMPPHLCEDGVVPKL